MRVLVTGHKGYIGTIMVPMLIESGHEVVGLDSDLYEQCTFGDEDGIQDIPALKKDIRDVGRTEENYRIRELAEIVAETVPGSRVEYAEGAGVESLSISIPHPTTI